MNLATSNWKTTEAAPPAKLPDATKATERAASDWGQGQGVFHQPPVINPVKRSAAQPEKWLIWLVGWIGTTVAGGVFGGGLFLIAGIFSGEPGMLFISLFATMIGCLIAGFVGVLVMPTVGVILWALFLDRGPRSMTALGGAITGMICGLAGGPLSLITMALGAAGAALFTHWLVRDSERKSKPDKTPLQFSLSDLFWRVTTVAALLSCWLSILHFLGIEI